MLQNFLYLFMNNLILIAGDLAAGKSTLAYALGEALNYIVLTKDELKEIECDVFSYTCREENLKLSKAAFQNMLYFCKNAAKVGSNLILDSNFRSKEVCEIADIAYENGYTVTLFYLTGEYEVLYERFLARIPTRHRAHISIGLQENFDKYMEYNDNLRNQDLVFEKHIIDVTNMGPEKVLETVLEILKENDIC